jgi:hypothetical protein
MLNPPPWEEGKGEATTSGATIWFWLVFVSHSSGSALTEYPIVSNVV